MLLHEVTLLGADGHTVVATTTTANNPVGGAAGWYHFDNLAPGQYQVQFTAPRGDVFTTQYAAAGTPAHLESPHPDSLLEVGVALEYVTRLSGRLEAL